ncbi:acetylcholine receptor subunit alpha-L1-like [Ostrinia furnacalis]|uniref:acetylcholine receptor subunit alpha-L1-like n=1 Tax=Ostrinia furnacalis TaxID=93504 RepID=UPI0010398369|nr:acetylcholine receptor subunit alpha-L1-like [Ostrinia furnacalis]
MAHATLLVFIVLNYLKFIYGECPPERVAVDHFEAKLHKDLFCAYDYSYRPVKDHRSTVNVSVRFAVKYISFDASEETFNVHSWVALKWKDEFLTWDPSEYGNITEIQVESHEIWTPRMSLYNADAALYQSDQIFTTCLLHNTGNVTCIPHVPHSGICRSTLKYWPYDKQNCTMYFGSWMHTGEQINFTFFNKSAVILDDYQPGPGWSLLRVIHERLPGNFACCPTVTYPMLKYTFMMKRESAGLAAIIVVPSVVIIMMTMVSLLLDVKDNNRLGLQCFSLFGHFIFLTEIGYSIPKHGADTPILILFIRDSMVVTLICILLTLLMMSLRKRVEQVPVWLKSLSNLVISGPGRYVIFTEFDPSNAEDQKNLSENEPNESQSRSDWITLAEILNNIVFIIFVIVYVVLLSVYIPTDTK